MPEGIEGRVPYKGSVVAILFQLAGGLRASMGYCGCGSIADMQAQAEFVQITSAAFARATSMTFKSPKKPLTTESSND